MTAYECISITWHDLWTNWFLGHFIYYISTNVLVLCVCVCVCVCVPTRTQKCVPKLNRTKTTHSMIEVKINFPNCQTKERLSWYKISVISSLHFMLSKFCFSLRAENGHIFSGSGSTSRSQKERTLCVALPRSEVLRLHYLHTLRGLSEVSNIMERFDILLTVYHYVSQ
jgi:hypothetical protein